MKDPLDAPLTFDKDGLDLAFKYFSSSTLTMRLAGITQINSHINIFNELCNNESIIEVENVGQNLAQWLIENQIISHIFGPNLHVEVMYSGAWLRFYNNERYCFASKTREKMFS